MEVSSLHFSGKEFLKVIKYGHFYSFQNDWLVDPWTKLFASSPYQMTDSAKNTPTEVMETVLINYVGIPPILIC